MYLLALLKQTNIEFDYVIDNEDFGNMHLIPLYLEMDMKSIIKTSYARLNDKRPKAKVLALQTIARYDESPGVDSVIVKALNDWDISIKGYAVVALGIHRKNGNFKPVLSAYMKHPELHDVIIETLEKSPTREDIIYAQTLKKLVQ